MSDEVGFSPWPGPRPRRNPRSGRRHAGLCLHGQGPHQRLQEIPYMIYPPPAVPRLIAIAGRDSEGRAGSRTALRLREATPIGRRCSRMTASSFSTTAGPTMPTPSLHRRGQAGKHILCEKPLARNADEAGPNARSGYQSGRQTHGSLQLPLRARHPPATS